MRRHLLGWVLVAAVFSAAARAGETPAEPGNVEAEVQRLLDEGCAASAEGRYFEALDRFEKAESLAPEDSRPPTYRGMIYIGIWRYDEAREALMRGLSLDAKNVPALTWLGRCEIYDLEYARSFAWLQKALDLQPSNPDVLAVLGLLYIHLDELDRAEGFLERSLSQNETHDFAHVCRAHLKILRKDARAAAREFARVLKRNRWSASAYVGLGQALSHLDRRPEALMVLNEGRKRNPHLPPVHSTRAFVLYKLKRVGEAMASYRKALALDPWYAGGHGIYPFFPAKDSENRFPAGEAGEALKEAVKAMRAGDARRAAEKAAAAVWGAEENVFAWLLRGAAAYALETPDTALRCARKAIELEAEAPLPHVLFIAGRSMKQEMKKLELSKEDFHERFSSLADPPVPGIERVFTNFSSLTPDGRKVVRLAVAPLAHYLPKLEEEGVRHYILPLYRHLTDVPAMSPWKGKPTFDGRIYDGVRGAAGKVAVTGVETLWATTRMGPSTIAHEFAHQIHRYAVGGEIESEISRLYKKAKKEGCCLDYYAAENEMEYFAQGYEAFLSPFKRPTSSETAKNTRADLQRKDPGLFRLLMRLTRGWEAPEGKRR